MTQSLVRLIHTMACPIDDMIVGSINAPRKKERKEERKGRATTVRLYLLLV